MTLGRIGLSFLLLLAFSGAIAQDKSTRKSYPLSDRGAFMVSVPPTWADEVKQDDKTQPPGIAYRVGAGKDPQVLLTPMWPPRADTPRLKPDQVRKHVEQTIAGLRDQAVETDIPIVQFKGKAGAGFYFDATDRAPGPGEFKYLRQGLLMLDELLVGFTIMAHSRQDPVFRDAMQVLQGASRVKQP